MRKLRQQERLALPASLVQIRVRRGKGRIVLPQQGLPKEESLRSVRLLRRVSRLLGAGPYPPRRLVRVGVLRRAVEGESLHLLESRRNAEIVCSVRLASRCPMSGLRLRKRRILRLRRRRLERRVSGGATTGPLGGA